jgi:hypothetical protein
MHVWLAPTPTSVHDHFEHRLVPRRNYPQLVPQFVSPLIQGFILQVGASDHTAATHREPPSMTLRLAAVAVLSSLGLFFVDNPGLSCHIAQAPAVMLAMLCCPRFHAQEVSICGASCSFAGHPSPTLQDDFPCGGRARALHTRAAATLLPVDCAAVNHDPGNCADNPRQLVF